MRAISVMSSGVVKVRRRLRRVVVRLGKPDGRVDAVLQMLNDLAGSGTTVVMVTHSRTHAANAHRVVQMLDGQFMSGMQLAA